MLRGGRGVASVALGAPEASVPPGKFAARSRAVSRRLASLLLLAIASAIPRRRASPGAPIPPDLALRISRAGTLGDAVAYRLAGCQGKKRIPSHWDTAAMEESGARARGGWLRWWLRSRSSRSSG